VNPVADDEAMEEQLQQLQQQMAEMARQLNGMGFELQAARAENVQLRQVRDDSWQALQQVPGLVAAVTEQTQQMVKRSRQTLVDNKGLGKPVPFKNDEKEFIIWARKTESYMTGVYPELEPVLIWAAEHIGPITHEVLMIQYGNGADDADMIEDIEALNIQVYSCLDALTTGESSAIVGAAPKGNGAEVWRTP